MPSLSENRQTLRQNIRDKRRNVPKNEQLQAAELVYEQIIQSPAYRSSQHIALFLAADGEIDLTAVFTHAKQSGKSCYVPVCLHNTCTLEFYPWFPGEDLSTTPLGVFEPARREKQLAPEELDLVLTPLVAFDDKCRRMGMGKGFYDRTFAFKSRENSEKNHKISPKSPILLGIAHECQRVECLETAWWDVPLDAVITPVRCYGNTELL